MNVLHKIYKEKSMFIFLLYTYNISNNLTVQNLISYHRSEVLNSLPVILLSHL